MRFLRDNGLSIALLVLFVLSFAGQIVSGHAVEVRDAQEHHEPPPRMGEYLTSGALWEATGENWESEFLQMFVYVVLTVFLFQRGSSESKDPDEPDEVDREPNPERPGAPGPVRQGGFVSKVYENSLAIAFLVLFLVSLATHVAGGIAAGNEDRRLHGLDPLQLGQYLSGPQFWFESLQNWQSEFLSIALMVILSIWLRQKGSPESKPVDAAHHASGR
jgi:hypothetical protein